MSEAQRIIALGRRAHSRGEKLCLATVVGVEGSSYRKPGARLLLASSGERAGTISGGCLEAEVTRKAWWLTAHGARVERYSSFADEDGGMPYGLGCGGTVTLLLEQGRAVQAVLDAMERGLAARQPAVIVMAIAAQRDGASAGTLAVLAARESMPFVEGAGAGEPFETLYLRDGALSTWLAEAARTALGVRRSCWLNAPPGEEAAAPGTNPGGASAVAGGDEPESLESGAYRIEYLAPPPGLTIFGAGDDAQPIAELANTLGWRVTVADGRAHLARRDRFPLAAAVRVIDWEQIRKGSDPVLRAACGLNAEAARGLQAASSSTEPSQAGRPVETLLVEDGKGAAIGRRQNGADAGLDAGREDMPGSLISDELAILVTHSYEQDRALLTALLARPLQYLGVLGPRHRTERLLEEVAPLLGISIEEGFDRLYSPVGLDLGMGDPAAVALSIVAEIQAVLHGRSVAVRRSGDVAGAGA